MEKKSIGKFIAALRKANGMTQKELAEQLCVSDKAVSRWERDESLPDLTLIPVLADIFHVSCDEILRGERINPQHTTCQNQDWDTLSKKSAKQIERIINKSKTAFINGTVVCIGICMIGIFLALTGRYELFIFIFMDFTIAIVLEAIMRNTALAAVKDVKCETDALDIYKKFVFQTTNRVILAILILYGTFITFYFTWLWYFALLGGIITGIICHFVIGVVCKKNME